MYNKTQKEVKKELKLELFEIVKLNDNKQINGGKMTTSTFPTCTEHTA